MTVVPVFCIRAICHEHQCAEDNNYQLCFHDDDPLMPLLPELREPLMDKQRRTPFR
jgi:hypothetical protein